DERERGAPAERPPDRGGEPHGDWPPTSSRFGLRLLLFFEARAAFRAASVLGAHMVCMPVFSRSRAESRLSIMGVTMNLKIALISATAVGLLMSTGAAYAGGGDYTYLNQAGDGQIATVDQSTGYNDKVGTGTGGNSFYQNDQVAGY